MRFPLLFLLLTTCFRSVTQNLYFPPLTGDEWAAVDPAELGWCADRLDSLLQFVEEHNTRAFIILKGGRIAVERYFGTYTQDSLWYWASAGKSLAAFLVGLAQEDEYLSLDDPTAQYLGAGWTSCDPEEEARIKIIHQITMTSGLDDSLENLLGNDYCLKPECLVCLQAPGSRWSYHNAPYRLVQDVLEMASGYDLNIYTRLRLGNYIGMRGFWFDYIYYSRARDMARFGLLALNRGVWAGQIIMADTAYFNRMTTPSQNLNPSYGYLWWLNGQDSYLLPGFQIRLPGPLIPEAPADLIAALGKDDQKIYVVPSQGLVVVRQGLSAGGVWPAASSFDNQLWARISALDCTTATRRPAPATEQATAFPNPAGNTVTIRTGSPARQIDLWDLQGRLVRRITSFQTNASAQVELDLNDLPAGVYLVRAYTETGVTVGRVVKR